MSYFLSVAQFFWVLVIWSWAMIFWMIGPIYSWLVDRPHIDFICRFSEKYWDIHDYHERSGGDGTPSHFFQYKCWNCKKGFSI